MLCIVARQLCFAQRNLNLRKNNYTACKINVSIEMVGLNPEVPRLYHARVLLLGEARVGKTALAESFVSNGTEFPKNYSMTNGIRLHSKIIQIPNTNDSVDMLLVDCAGAAVYHDFRKKAVYYRRVLSHS